MRLIKSPNINQFSSEGKLISIQCGTPCTTNCYAIVQLRLHMRSININEECSVSLEIYCSILDLPENAFSDYSIFLLDGRNKMPLFHLQIYPTINIFLSFFSVCNIIVHEKCLKTVSLPCVSIAATIVKVNVETFAS